MKSWFNSVRFAWNGIVLLLKTERNARIEFIVALGVTGLGIWLSLSLIEWSIIMLCIGGVLSAEAFNSAIERVADLYSKEIHPDVKILKDISAGAVLILAILSFGIGLLILGPPLLEKIGIP